MKKYIYLVYSPILEKTFTHERSFESEADLRLHCYALYSGNWKLISIA